MEVKALLKAPGTYVKLIIMVAALVYTAFAALLRNYQLTGSGGATAAIQLFTLLVYLCRMRPSRIRGLELVFCWMQVAANISTLVFGSLGAKNKLYNEKMRRNYAIIAALAGTVVLLNLAITLLVRKRVRPWNDPAEESSSGDASIEEESPSKEEEEEEEDEGESEPKSSELGEEKRESANKRKAKREQPQSSSDSSDEGDKSESSSAPQPDGSDRSPKRRRQLRSPDAADGQDDGDDGGGDGGEEGQQEGDDRRKGKRKKKDKKKRKAKGRKRSAKRKERRPKKAAKRSKSRANKARRRRAPKRSRARKRRK